MTGKLYLVATPIGNLSDITLRAIETLKGVDMILCEDTRVTQTLLNHFEIKKPTLSYHHHSDARKVNEIKALLEEGKNLALVTDAGTPGISDPGNILIHSLVKANVILSEAKDLLTNKRDSSAEPQNDKVEIIPIPGVSAVTAALSISGFATDSFIFLGFPPHKNKRQKYFKEVAEQTVTTVFFESGHRITKCITDLAAVLEPKRQIVICRELTKKFETIYRGTIAEIAAQKMDERGEFVIIVQV